MKMGIHNENDNHILAVYGSLYHIPLLPRLFKVYPVDSYTSALLGE